MRNPFFQLNRRAGRRFAYGFLAIFSAFSLWLGHALRTPAISLGDLIFQGIQVIQLSNINDQQEVQIGQQMDQSLVRREFRIVQNPAIANYVNTIGQKLAKESDRANLPFTFRVVENSSVNAFATVGGFVYITTGLMRAADNEAQLAGVIGHEIGHITGRHLIEQMKNDAIYSGIANIAGINQNQLAALGVELALRRPRSREDEFDADRRGLLYMGKSGYAQSAVPVFMAKLQGQASRPDFLSTHPAPADRVQRLRQNIDPAYANGTGLDNAAYQSRLRAMGLIR